MLLTMAVVIICKIVSLVLFGMYKRLWEHAGSRDASIIALSVTAGTFAAYFIISLISGPNHIIKLGDIFGRFPVSRQYFMPRSVAILDLLISVILIGTSRFILRFIARGSLAAFFQNQQQKRLLIVGAGEAGNMVLREAIDNPEFQINPVVFVDDDMHKQGMRIGKCKVAGTTENIPEIVKRYHISEIIIAMPSARPSEIRRVMKICEKAKVNVKIVPGTREILRGDVHWNQIREVTVEDLLGREVVKLDTGSIRKYITGRTVLVTGAGGSIGSEICRQIVNFKPKRLLILGHGENSIYELQQEMLMKKSVKSCVPIIADVRYAERIMDVFTEYKPDVVFHAAAHKHVPLMEYYPAEAVMNNIMGTKNCIDAAVKSKVKML